MSMDRALPERSWHASLDLEFRRSGATTALGRRRHVGPLRVQKPFYPGDGACHVYVLHPPGGVAGGDSLALKIQCVDNTNALVTNPAATKIYRSNSAHSDVSNHFRVANSASLEWLPHDTIVFGGSRLRQRTIVDLAEHAAFFGSDVISLGRPRSGDHYQSGTLEQHLEIRVDDRPQLIERQQWSAGDAVLKESWGLGGCAVVGALYCYPANESTLAQSRAALRWARFEVAAATLVDRILILRAIGNDGVKMQERIRMVWSSLRNSITGLAPHEPRVWAT